MGSLNTIRGLTLSPTAHWEFGVLVLSPYFVRVVNRSKYGEESELAYVGLI